MKWAQVALAAAPARPLHAERTQHGEALSRETTAGLAGSWKEMYAWLLQRTRPASKAIVKGRNQV